MGAEAEVKQQVREFYDSVGWKQVGEGLYQNARYEDLRPVSREYIHRCHLRVGRHLPEHGTRLLDAGSGPIQYPEYLAYSRGFGCRVCLDISRLALIEARRRIGGHGRFVVGDIVALPFRAGTFDGVVSLHTVHHLPEGEQPAAIRELRRVLSAGGRGVVVHSWGEASALMRWLRLPIAAAFLVLRAFRRLRVGGQGPAASETDPAGTPTGTYTRPANYASLRAALGEVPDLEVRVWRTVSTSFLRAFIHRRLAGAFWLRLLYALEEAFPHVLGRVGQYAMILFTGPGLTLAGEERST